MVTSDAKPATMRKRKSISSRVNESDSSESDSSESDFIPRKRSVYTSSLREKRPRGMLFETRVSE